MSALSGISVVLKPGSDGQSLATCGPRSTVADRLEQCLRPRSRLRPLWWTSRRVAGTFSTARSPVRLAAVAAGRGRTAAQLLPTAPNEAPP
jgi:hypothetical protein